MGISYCVCRLTITAYYYIGLSSLLLHKKEENNRDSIYPAGRPVTKLYPILNMVSDTDTVLLINQAIEKFKRYYPEYS